MPSFVWAKLWIDTLDDPKVGLLPDHLWRRFFELVLVAVEHNQDGEIPVNYDLASRLHTPTVLLQRDLLDLENEGLLAQVNGKWTLPYFSRYAGPHPGTWHWYDDKEWLVLRKSVLERDGHICQYCGAEATQADHIVPKCQGGDDALSNLVAACEHCNKSKGGRTPEEAGMELWPEDDSSTAR